MSGTRIQVNLETAVDAALINPSRYNQIKIAVDAAHGLSQSQAVGTEGSGRGEGVVGGGGRGVGRERWRWKVINYRPKRVSKYRWKW